MRTILVTNLLRVEAAQELAQNACIHSRGFGNKKAVVLLGKCSLGHLRPMRR